MTKTVLVGMSGGVDSSVVALMLKEQGYDVIGCTMQVWTGKYKGDCKVNHSCYGPDEIQDIEDTKEIAKKLDIPFYVIDVKDEYEKQVIDYFKAEYAEGKTPNPCVKCNWKIKFGALIDTAKKQGIQFDYFATGHYAKIEHDKTSDRYLLKRAKDQKKDQTYFLSFLSQQQLKQCMFPLGDFLKPDIKKKAEYFGMKLEERPESQNFAAMGHEVLLEGTSKPGAFIDMDGNVIGQHKGISYYTVGQRKGIGISADEPLYVIKINATDNTVQVGPKSNLQGTRLIAKECNWVAIDDLKESMEVTAKIRYVQKEDPAIITPRSDGGVDVEFLVEQSAITPGQAVVFYQGDALLGAGIISR